jgi:hypothetical protein
MSAFDEVHVSHRVWGPGTMVLLHPGIIVVPKHQPAPTAPACTTNKHATNTPNTLINIWILWQ